MEDSDSKRHDPVDFEHNEETRLLKELQALLSCSVPTDLLLSILQSQMLSHSNHEIHQSISHLLITYSGKRGTIANTTILPLDVAQIIRYLFGVSIAIINCTQHTTLKDLLTKLPVHSTVNYKEWTKQLKNRLKANKNKKLDKKDENDDDKDIKKASPKQENKDSNDDTNELASQILILSDNITPSNPRNTISIVHPRNTEMEHEESHSSLCTDQYMAYQKDRRLLTITNENSNTNNDKSPLKLQRYLTDPSIARTSRTASPSATPPPLHDESKDKDTKELQNTTSPPFGYGIHEEHAVSSKYHHHHYNRNREHLSSSIHSLHKLQHAASNPNVSNGNAAMNTAAGNGANGGANKASSKYKMDVISCQVILFHNIDKLSRAMQSIVVQIMKMKSVPSPEHANQHVKSSPTHQLCICTRQCNKSIPYLLRDLCFIQHVIPSKKCLKKMHKFVKYDRNEHKQSYYSHVSGISFDGAMDSSNKLNTLTVNPNTSHLSYNPVQSQSPTSVIQMGGANSTSLIKKEVAPMNDMTSLNPQSGSGLFSVSRLRSLYCQVDAVFIHNSIAQYIRDIIVAIRLHPDVKQGCSSFRANEALKIASKFIHFMSQLSERYKRLRNSSSNVDQLIARVHFVRPKDVDMMAIQILSHRIDTIDLNEYSPANTPPTAMANHISDTIRHHRFLNNHKMTSAFSPVHTNYHRSKDHMDPPQESDSMDDDDDDDDEYKEEVMQAKKTQEGVSKHTRAEILKQLRLDHVDGLSARKTRRHSGAYRTGSMSVPRTPRLRRSVSQSGATHAFYYQRSHEISSPNTFARRRVRSRSRTIGNRYNNDMKEEKKEDRQRIETEGAVDIDIDDFEFEVFSDSDDYHYDLDDEANEYPEYTDGDDEEYEREEMMGGDYGGDMNNEHMNDMEYDDYDDYDEDMDRDYQNRQNVMKRNSSNRQDNDPQYSLLNETNEKKLTVEQRLVYNLLKRVLLPPK
eukprot:446633_1